MPETGCSNNLSLLRKSICTYDVDSSSICSSPLRLSVGINYSQFRRKSISRFLVSKPTSRLLIPKLTSRLAISNTISTILSIGSGTKDTPPDNPENSWKPKLLIDRPRLAGIDQSSLSRSRLIASVTISNGGNRAFHFGTRSR